MCVKNYIVEKCDIKCIKNLIIDKHYTHSITGIAIKHCFKISRNGEIIGGMIYGNMAIANVWKKYAHNIDDIVELRRMVCIDDTLKNTESYFIGKTLRWLKNNTNYKLVISYADSEYNHTGIIYKASNFKLYGKTKYNCHYQFRNGEKRHSRLKMINRIKLGEFEIIKTKPKYIYLYFLDKKYELPKNVIYPKLSTYDSVKNRLENIGFEIVTTKPQFEIYGTKQLLAICPCGKVRLQPINKFETKKCQCLKYL
jgi:hypothetical protein